MNDAYASSLAAKHAHLESRIHAEKGRPSPDGQSIARLKKLKLRLKEAMTQT